MTEAWVFAAVGILLAAMVVMVVVSVRSLIHKRRILAAQLSELQRELGPALMALAERPGHSHQEYRPARTGPGAQYAGYHRRK